MSSHGYLAGTDSERLQDLHAMFDDADVDGIVCARGGYGCGRLLQDIDYDIVRANPKVLVGYSDITALQIAFFNTTRLVTFWGPMVASEMGEISFGDYNRDWFIRAVCRKEPLGEISQPPDMPPVQVLNGGIGTGPLIGGTLSLLAASLGTPYEISTDGAILFFEDVGEEPHKLDRMLNQLYQSGKLNSVNGVVIGECAGCGSGAHKPAFPYGNFSIEEIFHDYFSRLHVPVIYGLAIGHGKHKSTLPIGVQATLDADSCLLRIDEAGVQ